MGLCTFKTRERSWHPHPWHPKEKKKKKRSRCTFSPPRMILIFSLGTCMAGCLRRRRGPHNHPQRSRQDQLQSASGSTWLCLSPILCGDQLWSECGERQAQWCCCYKYASTSVSKWQLYSGPRTHCLGTVRASHSKKGKPSVGALVDMYLCTCSNWYVVRTAQIAALDCAYELKCCFKSGCSLTSWRQWSLLHQTIILLIGNVIF